MMNLKTSLIAASIAVTVLAGVASLVVADTTPAHVGPAMVLSVNANGKILLRGTIDSMSTNSITVKGWGGDWIVNLSSNTQLLPTTDITQFHAGDYVGVQGIVTTGSAWTIDGTIVRDWTVKQAEVTARQSIQGVIKANTPKNWQGTASNVNTSSNSFTLTIDSVAYTVNVAAGASVVNQVYLALPLANIKNGDTVRVYATVSGTTATAYVVRDISIK